MKNDSTNIILNLCEQRVWNSSLTQIELSHGEGNIMFDVAIKKARLALKYRRNTKQTRRIIILVASPVNMEQKDIISIARDLKKNNLSLDIICFGISKNHESKTVKKLNEMIRICNHTNNCHFLHLENEKKIKLQEIIMKSNIIKIGGNFPLLGKQSHESPNQFEKLENFPDIDLQTDPELYHAIRLSIQMAHQEKEKHVIKNDSCLKKTEIVKSMQMCNLENPNEINLTCAIAMGTMHSEKIINYKLQNYVNLYKEDLIYKRKFIIKLIKELPRIEDEIKIMDTIVSRNKNSI